MQFKHLVLLFNEVGIREVTITVIKILIVFFLTNRFMITAYRHRRTCLNKKMKVKQIILPIHSICELTLITIYIG